MCQYRIKDDVYLISNQGIFRLDKFKEEGISMYSHLALSSQELKEALLEATRRGDNLEIDKLVAAGADIHKAIWYGQNALHLAAVNGHIKTIDYLINEHNMDVNGEDDSGETAYTLAVVNAKAETARQLREKYTITIKSSKELEAGLRKAAQEGDNNQIDYLVSCCCRVCSILYC